MPPPRWCSSEPPDYPGAKRRCSFAFLHPAKMGFYQNAHTSDPAIPAVAMLENRSVRGRGRLDITVLLGLLPSVSKKNDNKPCAKRVLRFAPEAFRAGGGRSGCNRWAACGQRLFAVHKLPTGCAHGAEGSVHGPARPRRYAVGAMDAGHRHWNRATPSSHFRLAATKNPDNPPRANGAMVSAVGQMGDQRRLPI